MKTNLIRIICAIFAFAILVCAFSACGSSADTGNDNASASSGGKSTIAGDDSTVTANKPGYTGVWENFDPYAGITDDMKGKIVRYATWIDHTQTEGAKPLANFYKDTGLNVELFTVQQGAYVERIITSCAAGDYPDAFKSNEGRDNFPLTLQLAAPIDKVSTVNLDEPIWHKSMLETGTIDGHVYLVNTIGSPWSGSNLVFFNKSLFELNGFKTPEQYYEEGNWTWSTMLKVLKDCAAIDGCAGGFVDMDILADSAGASFCVYDYKTATFSSGSNKKELVMAYQWVANARDQGLLGSMQDFIDGKAGICMTGVYGLKNTGHFKDMNFEDIGFTYLPSLEDGSKSKISSIYRMYGIVKGCKNANEAGYFLRYWLDPDNYDLENTFISNKAGNFYYALTNSEASDKYFNFDDNCGTLIGAAGASVFYGPAGTASAAAVPTALKSTANKVDEAVTKANAIIQQLIQENR